MDIGCQNSVIKSFEQFEKKTVHNLDSPNEFHQSFSNSDCDNEHGKLMIAEDEESTKLENENKNKPLLNCHSDLLEPNGNFAITNSFLQPQNTTDHLFSESMIVHRDQFKDTKPNLCASHNLLQVSKILEGPQSMFPGNQDRRKRGRPRKLFFVQPDLNREKRPRGRPRKTDIADGDQPKPVKEKKSVGRPRIYFNVEPKEKRPRGRPRVNFNQIKKPSDESGEKRPRGRPRKYLIHVIKEKRSRGRPRSNLRLDSMKKSTRKRGRPSKNASAAADPDWHSVLVKQTLFKAIKEEESSAESNEDEDEDADSNSNEDEDNVCRESPFTERAPTRDTAKSAETSDAADHHQLPRKRGRPKRALNLIKYSKLDDTSSIEEGNTLSSSVSNADSVEEMM